MSAFAVISVLRVNNTNKIKILKQGNQQREIVNKEISRAGCGIEPIKSNGYPDF